MSGPESNVPEGAKERPLDPESLPREIALVEDATGPFPPEEMAKMAARAGMEPSDLAGHVDGLHAADAEDVLAATGELPE